MAQLEYLSPDNPLGPENRKTVLLVWGILLILLGSIAGCLAIFTPLTALMPAVGSGEPSPGQKWQVLAAFVMYAVVAVVLIWTGMGSLRAQRWVRPIVLIFATLWLIGGIVATVVTVVTIPALQAMVPPAPAPGAPPAPAPPVPVMFIGVGCIGAAFVVLPAVILWFYRDPAVRTTLEYYDPRPRWTDAVPLPVLGMSLTLALVAVWLVPTAAAGNLVLFGGVASGALAAVLTLLMAAAFALAAWWTYRLRVAGWWLAVALVSVLSLSVIWSMLTLDPGELYAHLGVAPAEVDAMIGIYRRQQPVQIALAIVLLLAALGYAIYVRRWFAPATEAPPSPAPPAAAG